MADEFRPQKITLGNRQFLLLQETGEKPYVIYVYRSRKGMRGKLVGSLRQGSPEEAIALFDLVSQTREIESDQLRRMGELYLKQKEGGRAGTFFGKAKSVLSRFSFRKRPL